MAHKLSHAQTSVQPGVAFHGAPNALTKRRGAVTGTARPLRASTIMALITLCLTSACGDNFIPADKQASYDPVKEELTLPAPCPDWSQSTTTNYLNAAHSNFGCAVNTNTALQLDNPQDMNEGHGNNKADTALNVGVIEQFRAGKLPKELSPLQASSRPQQ